MLHGLKLLFSVYTFNCGQNKVSTYKVTKKWFKGFYTNENIYFVFLYSLIYFIPNEQLNNTSYIDIDSKMYECNLHI